jgi:hypothetical protein
MAKLTNPEPLGKELTEELERLRSKHRLRALTEDESGTGFQHLPNGVFGFTYSCPEENFPLFKNRDLRSFESHKLEDGSVFILGFLTREEKSALEQPAGSPGIHLLPEPKAPADQLVRVPLARVARHVEHSARMGSGLELFLKPA